MLTEVQLFILAAVASVIVYGLKLAKVAEKPAWLTTLVYVVSLVLAFLFAPPAIPPFPACGDLAACVPAGLSWIGELLVPLSAVVGFATLLYNTLLKQVLDRWVAPLLVKKAA